MHHLTRSDIASPSCEAVVEPLCAPQPSGKDQLPLMRDAMPPTSYPIDMLGPVMAPAVESIKNLYQTSGAICAHSVLAAAALAAQPLANVLIDGRRYPLSLFLVTIAGSGERKSAVDRLVLSPFRERQRSLMLEYQKQLDLLEQITKQDAAKQEGHRIKRPTPQPTSERPRRPYLLVSEPTMEGLFIQLKEGFPSLGLFSDEAGGFLGGYACQSERRMHATAALCKLWDGDPLDRIRKTDGCAVIYDCRVSMHLMGQEILLEKLVQDPLADTMGLMSRCLVSFPSSSLGNRTYVRGDPLDDPAIKLLLRALEVALNRSLALGKPVPRQISPRDLALCAKGMDRWIAFYDSCEILLAESASHKEISRFVCKLPEHVLRLSGVMTILEEPDAQIISEVAVERASHLATWYMGEARRLRHLTVPDHGLNQAGQLLEWMRRQGKSDFWIGEIYRNGPPAFRKASDARRALQILAQHGWVFRSAPRMIEGMERVEIWSLQ